MIYDEMYCYSPIEPARRGPRGSRLANGMEQVLLCPTGVPFRCEVDYEDWAKRTLHLRRTDAGAELFDTDTGEAVREWLSSDLPIPAAFLDAVIGWAENHDGNPFGLGTLLEDEIGPAAAVVMEQFVYAEGISAIHAQSVADAFRIYLETQIENVDDSGTGCPGT